MTMLPNTLSFRLTLWYSASFVAVLAAALFGLYVSINSILNNRIDEDLEEDIEEFTMLFKTEGIESVKEEINREGKTGDTSEIFLRLLNSNGEQFYSSDLTHWKGIHTVQSTLEKVASNDYEIWLETVEFQSQEEDTRVAYGLIGPDTIIQIGESTEEKEEIMGLLLAVFTLMFLIAVPIAATVGWLMARHGVKGIEEINKVAIDIRNGEFNRRVSINKQHDEVQTLANTFNAMVERINSLMIEMREMIDNIAHDLRSPLARIRAISENTLSEKSNSQDFKTAAEDTLEECDRLIQMVNNTLDVAEAEAGVTSRIKENVDLAKLIEDACELFDPVAEDKKVELMFNLKPTCKFHGNKQSLQRMFANLIDNAVKYTKSDSTVNINLKTNSHNIVINISDEGYGIPKEDQHRVFERFFRCDNSRSNKGNGLGLSYARAVARSHGGDIRLDGSSEQGSSFTVLLPI